MIHLGDVADKDIVKLFFFLILVFVDQYKSEILVHFTKVIGYGLENSSICYVLHRGGSFLS